MAKVLINDGCIRNGNFQARGVIPAVKFRYRQALPAKVYDYLQLASPGGRQRINAMVELLEKQLVSWDVDHPDKDGELAAINQENLHRTPPPVLEYMLDAVCSWTTEKMEADAKN